MYYSIAIATTDSNHLRLYTKHVEPRSAENILHSTYNFKDKKESIFLATDALRVILVSTEKPIHFEMNVWRRRIRTGMMFSLDSEARECVFAVIHCTNMFSVLLNRPSADADAQTSLYT